MLSFDQQHLISQLMTSNFFKVISLSFPQVVGPFNDSLNAVRLKFGLGCPWSSPSLMWPVHSQWSLVFEVQQQTPESLYSHHSSLSLWTLYDLPLCSGRLVGCVHSGISIFTLKRQNLRFFFSELTSVGRFLFQHRLGIRADLKGVRSRWEEMNWKSERSGSLHVWWMAL